MACYLSWEFSTLMKVFKKCVHKLVFRIAVSYWDWQSLCTLKPFNIIDCRLPSFMCNLLESPIIPTFISKRHVCTMWLQFFKTFDSIFWELRNQSSDVYIDISMLKFSDSLFWIILNNIITSFFLIIKKNFTSFSVLWKIISS